MAVLAAALLVAASAGAADVQALIGGITNPSADARAEAWKGAGPVGAAGVAPLADQMAAGDPEVALAAARALDNIVDYATRPGADAEQAAVAAELAKLLDPARPEAVRSEAVRLLAMCATDAEAPAVAALLTDKPELAEDARLTLQQVPGAAATQALVAALPNLQPRAQAAVAETLAGRKAVDAVPALKELAGSTPEPRLRWALLAPLAKLGVPPQDVVPRDAADRPAQRRWWDAALVHAANAKAEAGDKQAAVDLFSQAAAQTEEDYLAEAALVGLAGLDAEALVPRAVEALKRPGASATATRLLAAVQAQNLDQTLADAYPAAEPAQQAALLEVMAARKSPGLDALLPDARQKGAPEVRLAASEIAGTTPTVDLLVEVLEQGSPTGRDRAASALLAAAQEAEADSAGKALALYERVIRAGTGSGHTVLAFNGLERMAKPESVALLDELVAPLFSPSAQASETAAAFRAAADRDAALAVAAGRAYVAAHAAQGKDEAVPVLLAVVEAAPVYDISSLAIEKLAGFGIDPQGLARSKGFITDWQILGPFPNVADAAFGQALIPEGDAPLPETAKAGDQEIKRIEAQTEGLPAVLNLRGIFRRAEEVAAYAYAEVKSDTERPVVFLLGSDDGCEFWVNGQKLHAVSGGRGLIVDGDRIEATLRPGVNRVLIKVLQGGADWKYCVRIADRDGKPVDLNQ